MRRFVATGELHATDGSSIGAAMRALPFGWATPVAATGHRRELTIWLSRTTHGAPEAIISACVVAEMAAWAIEQHPVDAVIAAGLREAEDLAQQHALHPATLQPLRQAIKGDWPPKTAGLTLDAFTTVESVLQVLREANGLATAMKHAVALGRYRYDGRRKGDGLGGAAMAWSAQVGRPHALVGTPVPRWPILTPAGLTCSRALSRPGRRATRSERRSPKFH